jgi:hypothetical protein
MPGEICPSPVNGVPVSTETGGGPQTPVSSIAWTSDQFTLGERINIDVYIYPHDPNYQTVPVSDQANNGNGEVFITTCLE